MKMTKRNTGRASSLPAGLGMGIGTSLAITVFFTALIAILLEKETITWETAGYGIMAMLIISSFAGARVSYIKIKRQKLWVSIFSGLLYLATLLSITALFFGGQYEAVSVTLMLVSAGCGSAALLRGWGNSGRKGRIPKHGIVKLNK